MNTNKTKVRVGSTQLRPGDVLAGSSVVLTHPVHKDHGVVVNVRTAEGHEVPLTFDPFDVLTVRR